jgi:signal transduction histidine kinase
MSPAAGDLPLSLAEEHALLCRAATLVAEGGSPEAIFAALASDLASLLQADAMGLLRFDRGHGALVVASQPERLPGAGLGARLGFEDVPVLESVVETGEPVLIGTEAVRPGHPVHRAGLRALAGAPILVGGRPWGVAAGAWRRPPPELHPQTLERLGAISRLIAAAIVNADGREELRRRAREQAALRRVTSMSSGGHEPAEIFEVVAREARESLASDASWLARFDAEGDRELVCRTGEGDGADDGRVLEAPVWVEGRLWGALGLAWQHAEPPSRAQERAARFAQALATAVASTRNRAALAALAAEQAALRRVAMLVAEGASPGAVFEAIAREATTVLGVKSAALLRFAPDGSARLMTSAEPVPSPATSASAPVTVDGSLWGAMVVSWAPDDPMPSGSEWRLAAFTELAGTAIANSASRAELEASRARLVDADAEERRRLRRDLHDGVQRRLAGLALELETVRAEARESAAPAELCALYEQAARGLQEASAQLEAIAGGLHPAALDQGGLEQGLRALARQSAIPLSLDLRTSVAELPESVQVAVYYVASEALANAVKHAGASLVSIAAEVTEDQLRVTIGDDGTGGADPARGTGLLGLQDRIHALGGRLQIDSPSGVGTLLRLSVPLSTRTGARW